MDPRQRPRLLEIIQNLRERITEARGNDWLGEVGGLQVSFDAAMAQLNSLKRAPTDGRPQLVDLGMPVFTDPLPEAREQCSRPVEVLAGIGAGGSWRTEGRVVSRRYRHPLSG